LLFDGHADIWSDVVQKRLSGEREIFRNYHLDKFKEGGVGGGIFVMWIDPPHDQHPEQRLREIMSAARDEIIEAEDLIQIVKAYSDFEAAVATGKMPVVIGVEGLSGIGEDLNQLDALYAFGARHASLTWNEANALATGLSGDPLQGLTQLGFEAVKKLETLGMLVDVSHLNDKSFWDVLSISTKPLIASHSNSRAECDHKRNLTDDQLRAVAATGGLVGGNAWCDFIDLDPTKRTIERFVDHIEYMIELIGEDHVGLGFDFCDYIASGAMATFAEDAILETIGLENAAKAGHVIEILRRRGHKEVTLEKIASGNFMRVLKTILK
jgi:membrane dipeptidase